MSNTISIKFRCRLLSDVILQSQSTVGQLQRTTDFIPGNTFLGILARHYQDYSEEQQMQLFHSSQVRFGDAHPVAADGRVRSLRIPAAMYYPKLKGLEGGGYIHYIYNRAADREDGGSPQQLKQCRNGFYTFDADSHGMSPVVPDKTLSLKSAYNRERRASEDGKMYISESMKAGATFLFEVETDEPALEETIRTGLSGIHFIGRSRTAQFGRVSIEPFDYDDTPSTAMSGAEGLVTVYADSRLIFLDANGTPTFRPTARQLGVEGGTIDWSRSQVRTFQYAPWNGKRYSYDTDRCGIEKGSVFVIKTEEANTGLASRYVGSYQNEGFGRVIYNPAFLLAKPNTNGEALYRLAKPQTTAASATETPIPEGPLMQYLLRRQRHDEVAFACYERVNEFIKKYAWAYYDDNKDKGKSTFSSQWGEIREIVQKAGSAAAIKADIASFVGNTTFRQKKWDENRRYEKLRVFVEGIDQLITETVGRDLLLLKETLENLATEMAKESRKQRKE